MKMIQDEYTEIDVNDYKDDLNETIMISDDEEMSVFELARWLSLVEGITEIDKFAERNNIKTLDIKPIPMLKYVNERTPAMIKDVRFNECDI